MEKKTPLYDCHVAAGGKMVPFAGYLLPVQYEAGVIKEHMNVRTKVGLFDVSHMGEILFQGPDAFATVNNLVTNDVTDMEVGQCRYSPMCYEDGGTVDDLIIYKFADDCYYIVVNAANREKDYAWMSTHLTGDCTCEDISDTIAQLALQGPLAEEVLTKIVPKDKLPQENYSFIRHVDVLGVDCLVSRTGYTGEDGFEIYAPAESAPKLWDAIIDAGQASGILPCGLGARDTLRFEAAMPLYGHEMDATVSPYEAKLGIFVKLDKDHFIGKDALVPQKGNVTRKRVGLKVTGRGIIREECKVFDGDKEIGHVTSGTFCPYLDGAYGMALLPIDYQEIGTKVEVDVRGRRIPVEVIKTPFYKRA